MSYRVPYGRGGSGRRTEYDILAYRDLKGNWRYSRLVRSKVFTRVQLYTVLSMIIGIVFYTFSLFLPSLCFSPSFLSYLRALVFSPQKRWWLVCSTRKSEIQTKSNFSLAFPPSPFVINRPLPRFTTQYSKHYHHIVLSKISVFVFPLSLLLSLCLSPTPVDQRKKKKRRHKATLLRRAN